MADRHYGLDVSVMTVGSKNVKAVYESLDIELTPTVKETTAAQDTGPNKRVVGSDFTISLGKFIEGDTDWLHNYLKYQIDNANGLVSLSFVLATSGTGPSGTTWRTFTMTNCIVTKLGLNLGGEGSKESIEFSRGTGGTYTVSGSV